MVSVVPSLCQCGALATDTRPPHMVTRPVDIRAAQRLRQDYRHPQARAALFGGVAVGWPCAGHLVLLLASGSGMLSGSPRRASRRKKDSTPASPAAQPVLLWSGLAGRMGWLGVPALRSSIWTP